MKKIIRVIICPALCFLNFNFSFGQEIEWQNTIGGNSDDYFESTMQTSDGGYILAGYSVSTISGDKTENNVGGNDFWILKTDSNGNIEWQNTIGGNDSEIHPHIRQTIDGGYIIGGTSRSNISGDKTENSMGGFDYWIIKTDSLGNIEWENTIGGYQADELYSVEQTNDGGYILGGTSNSGLGGDKTEFSIGSYDYWIVKIDTLGNIQWQNTIGGIDQDFLITVKETLDKGYVLGGQSNSNISIDKSENNIGDLDYWIIKTDSVGTIQWQNTIGGIDGDRLCSIQQTTDGGFILGGSSFSNISGDKTENNWDTLPSPSYDYWIIKLNPLGNIQWQNTIGGVNQEALISIQQTIDGGYILGGSSSSGISGDKSENNIGSIDYWILKLDAVGNIVYQNVVGGLAEDNLTSLMLTNDGGSIIGGYSFSNISGDKAENRLGSWDYWILKLTDNYNLITGKTFADLNSNSTQDIGESFLINKTIIEQTTSRFAFSQQNGLYNVAVLDSGYFYVSPVPINYYNAVPVNHSATFTGINQTDSLNDFAFQPLGTFNDLCVTLTPFGAFRTGFDASYMINYENLGTTTLNGTVKIFPDNELSYVTSTQTPVSVNVDSIEWNVGSIAPFQSGNIVVTFLVSQTAPLGTITNTIAQIEPIANDANTSCNIDTAKVNITGSFDPNDILVSEDTLTTTQLASQPYLDYTIRFQNTGNDTAFTVKIINPIDTNKLELSSIEFVNASHTVNLKWVNYNRNMEFLFENILLPDSNINEPLSHGFVHYRIKPKTTLLAGDSITNKAYIYFDFNAPVETNTAVTRIVVVTDLSPNPSPQERGTLLCYPNPALDELNISLKNGKANQAMTVKVYDVFGKEILMQQSKTSNTKLQTARLSKGLYFVEVVSGKEVYRSKVVKE